MLLGNDTQTDIYSQSSSQQSTQNFGVENLTKEMSGNIGFVLYMKQERKML